MATAGSAGRWTGMGGTSWKDLSTWLQLSQTGRDFSAVVGGRSSGVPVLSAPTGGACVVAARPQEAGANRSSAGAQVRRRCWAMPCCSCVMGCNLAAEAGADRQRSMRQLSAEPLPAATPSGAFIGAAMPCLRPSRTMTPLRASYSMGLPASRSAYMELPESRGAAPRRARRSRRECESSSLAPSRAARPRRTRARGCASARATPVVLGDAAGLPAPPAPRRRSSGTASSTPRW